jgi:hypothetical protein
MDELSHANLEALWDAVERQWDDKTAHEAFLSACHEHRALGVAAAKYRAVIDGPQEHRRAAAQKRITSVALLATQALESGREPPPRNVPRWITVAAIMIATTAVGWFTWVLTR